MINTFKRLQQKKLQTSQQAKTWRRRNNYKTTN